MGVTHRNRTIKYSANNELGSIILYITLMVYNNLKYLQILMNLIRCKKK